MTIKEHLQRLTPEQMQQLQYAFEQGFAQFIDLGNGHFVGVNVADVGNLVILESGGCWSYGVIKEVA